MKKLFIFNSLTNKKEEFVPIKENEASIYVCGPTVYSSPHIGNFRPVISFDVLRRLLIKLGYKVTFVSNYTDVDDKIINRAKELGISEKELTESVIEEFSSLVKEVGSKLPDITPKPTEYMDQMIQYIDDLVKSGHAYVSKDGDVFFRVREDKDYGELSGNSIEELESGARIDVNSNKESPLDFALWKKTDVGIKWKSPWCEGRPGWHSECCVMIDSLFKDNHGLIDIHGGGFDLKFPHHENEIAQSRAHNGNHLANYWMHNGFINIDNEKMSKSLGNVRLMKDVVDTYGGLAFRLMILSAHYRAPVSFSPATIEEAKTNINRISTTYKQLAVKLQLNNVDLSSLKAKPNPAFLDALCDDLNTPNALTYLYEEIKKANQNIRVRDIDSSLIGDNFATIREYMETLGLEPPYPLLNEDDKALYNKYLSLKSEKRFEESDECRKLLIERGIL